ncbi:hypothetical protein THARTR1_09770 [Trichoderma harzianum]|uniref:Uncharacterized protein n=1 Tax=Trichoderma harzianum TaxID=5544 RepID=A0A2K0TV89_TRIHA|nr:hypothetical protein THARTR1_09770 [Trichoderma harzianum]
MASMVRERFTTERMMRLSLEPKPREKLVRIIARTEEQLQIVYEQIDTLRTQRLEIDRQIITYEQRLRLRAQVQDHVDAKENEAEELRELLATAVHQLEYYDETMQIKGKDSSSAASDDDY